MEAIAMPMRWEDFGEAVGIFRALRSGAGETMIMEQNAFVETILPLGILRKLTGKEMDSYRAPFLEREARLPTLVWPRQIPVEGEPADVTAIVEEYGPTGPGPKGCDENGPAAALRVVHVSVQICSLYRQSDRTALPAAHFDRNKIPRISGTGH
jgi:haloalkane dehalogenase